MKIVFVAPWLPARNRPRSLGLLRMLAEDHEISFVGLTTSDDDLARAAELPVDRCALVPLRRNRALARAARGLLTGESLQRSFAAEPAFRRTLDAELRTWRPDLVYLNVFRTTHLLPAEDWPTLVDLDEFRSEYYSQLADGASNPVWRLIGSVESRRMRAAEDALLASGTHLLLSSPADLPRAGTTGHLVRSPHALTHVERAPAPDVVLFVGRLCYRANVEAVVRFAEETWPLVRAARPTARLRLVGEAPSRAVRRLASHDIEVVGPVPDVTAHYATAAVSIVPVDLGTGVQMKLIESLATGVPTVATRSSADRAGVVHDEHVLTASTPQEWSKHLVRLLEDRASARRLGARGRLWAEEHYGDDALRRSLQAALHQAVPARVAAEI